MLKNQKGITLVALVITIVILIILATVSITLALNSGLMDQAEKGAELYSNAADAEEQQIDTIETRVNGIYKELNIVFD